MACGTRRTDSTTTCCGYPMVVPGGARCGLWRWEEGRVGEEWMTGVQTCALPISMNQTGPDGMWDEEDGFYYDVLRLPDGSARRLKVRSMVGLLPICATSVIEPWQRERTPRLTKILRDRLERMPELRDSIHPTGVGHFGYNERGIAALVNPVRLRRILTRMLRSEEFLSPYGIRALSRYHAD